MEIDPEKKDGTPVHYFKCEGCGSEVFWSEMEPSVERAALVFKWVRAGCPNAECGSYLILGAPEKIYDHEEARKIYDEKKGKGEKVYWI